METMGTHAMIDDSPVGTPEGAPVVTQWLNGLRIAHIVHSRAYTRFDRRQRIAGMVAAAVSALAAVLASIPGEGARAGVPLLSALAATVTGVVTALNHGALAERHRTAATLYGGLRRELEDTMARGEVREMVRRRWTEVDATAPPRPQDLERAARAEVIA